MVQLKPSLFALSLLFCGVPTEGEIHERDFGAANIITKDVAIIGGGASGTYAAVRLREDLNTSIVVVEPKGRLGGHVDTYTVPETNTTLEYGVQSYMQYGPTVDFFNRFDVELGPFSSRVLKAVDVDVETGAALNYTTPPAAAVTEALKKWQQFVENYNDLYEPGYWNFPPPDKIPAEFLQPFGEFVKQNNIEAAVPRIVVISGVGAGSLCQLPTLRVIQAFGAAVTKGVLDTGFVQPIISNSLLYQRAYDLLKEDVFLNSTVIETERDFSGVRLVLQSNGGKSKTLIKAKRILWTPVPSHGNLQTFDQDEKEKKVFADWVPEWNYVGVAKISCIPENTSVTFLPRAVEPLNHLAFRDYPYTLSLGTTGPPGLSLFRVMHGANFSVSYEEAEARVISSVQKLIDAGAISSEGKCEVDIKALSSHSGVLWPQGSEIIKEGFVQELYSLQGHRSTWWTGRSWCGEYSSNVWTFTDTVLERLLEDLK